MRGFGAWLALAAVCSACTDVHGNARLAPPRTGAGGKPAVGSSGAGTGGSPAGPLCFDCNGIKPTINPAQLCPRGPFPEDNDGVPAMVEQAAGLDPCDDDTDHDGCPDSAEYYAGGCDGVILLQEPCWGEPASSEVHVTLPSDRGPWRNVSVRASGAEGWAVLQIELLDDLDAGATDGDSFGPVPSGATLAYRVTADEARGDQALRARIEIVGDGEVLVEQRVIIVPAFSCPIPV